MSFPEQNDSVKLHKIFENLPPDKWNSLVDKLFADFPNGSLDGLLTTYFLRSTYPKIGGQIMSYSEGESRFWGLLLPRNNQDGYNWSVRSYWVKPTQDFQRKVESDTITFLDNLGINSVFWYETAAKQKEEFSGKVVKNLGSYEISFPNRQQAEEAVDLQRKIWNVTDPNYLYPFDLYRPDSGLATRLVATKGDKVIGFLFGFCARGHQWLGKEEKSCNWIESQLLGVEPQYRRLGIAKQLKFIQREQALNRGERLIRWTVDPLQAGNAFLNLNELGGIAAHFYPNYYPFQNDLNRVVASRIAVCWFVDSQRVRSRIRGDTPNLEFTQLKSNTSTEILYPIGLGRAKHFDTSVWKPSGEVLLIQIPSDWNVLQREDIKLAQSWREATDAIWSKILGIDDDSYALTGIVKSPEDGSVFLVAEHSPSKFTV